MVTCCPCLHPQSHPKPEQRIPYLIITNGGGVLETVKTREINDVFFPGLPNPIAESQVCATCVCVYVRVCLRVHAGMRPVCHSGRYTHGTTIRGALPE